MSGPLGAALGERSAESSMGERSARSRYRRAGPQGASIGERPAGSLYRRDGLLCLLSG
ncbi:hypothetical protein AB0M39_21130 [Streptomyces sp. NPDC051907]|uniref:hypothetical protein n=1 Tax=Streptomyces sp. NPDC051907 TaxID=3155284 RepID=UPI0034450B0D